MMKFPYNSSINIRKKSVGDQWKQKTAEEADLLLTDEEDEEECYQGRRKADSKHEIAQARRDLETCLKIPLTQHSYGGEKELIPRPSCF